MLLRFSIEAAGNIRPAQCVYDRCTATVMEGHAMDREQWERERDLAEFAKSEGADYYDPESPVLWKRFILGPLPWWRRLLWTVFPPGAGTLFRLSQRYSNRIGPA
jgi:hypothetical protein